MASAKKNKFMLPVRGESLAQGGVSGVNVKLPSDAGRVIVSASQEVVGPQLFTLEVNFYADSEYGILLQKISTPAAPVVDVAPRSPYMEVVITNLQAGDPVAHTVAVSVIPF